MKVVGVTTPSVSPPYWRLKRYPDEASMLPRFVLRRIEPAPDAALVHMARMSVRAETDGWTWKFDENVTRLLHCLPNVRSVSCIPASHQHLPVSQPVALVAALRVLLGTRES